MSDIINVRSSVSQMLELSNSVVNKDDVKRLPDLKKKLNRFLRDMPLRAGDVAFHKENAVHISQMLSIIERLPIEHHGDEPTGIAIAALIGTAMGAVQLANGVLPIAKSLVPYIVRTAKVSAEAGESMIQLASKLKDNEEAVKEAVDVAQLLARGFTSSQALDYSLAKRGFVRTVMGELTKASQAEANSVFERIAFERQQAADLKKQTQSAAVEAPVQTETPQEPVPEPAQQQYVPPQEPQYIYPQQPPQYTYQQPPQYAYQQTPPHFFQPTPQQMASGGVY